MGQKLLKATLLVLLLAFIWGNSMLSREVSGAISDALMEKMNTAAQRLGLGEDLFTFMADEDGDGIEEPTSYLVRKIAHVTEFAVLAILLRSVYQKKGARRDLWAFGTSMACAAADEAIQLFSHRGSRLLDVFIDAGGTLLGLMIAALVQAGRKRKQS